MADEFLRIGGRSESGYAKAIQTDDQGILKAGGKCEYIVYSKDNPLYPSLHNIRTTGEKYWYLPQMTNKDGNIVGIFDQTIQLYSDYDVAYNFILNQCFYIPNVGTKIGKALFVQRVEVGEQSILFTPYETTDFTDSVANKKIATVSELNHPIPFLRITINGFTTAPTVGDTVLAVTRRY